MEAPQLEEILLPTDLQEGQIVQIHCNLKSGDSPVYYSWLKDGKKIPNHLKVSFMLCSLKCFVDNAVTKIMLLMKKLFLLCDYCV